MEKISIIIPVYNVEPYIKKCIESIINQTYKNLEIICVDDGTPDNSVKIIREYMQNDDRIKIISQENQGLSAARNTGIKAANGKYTVFVDSDDWLNVETIKTAVENAEKNNADTVIWGYVREFGENSSVKNIFDSDKIFDSEETKHIVHRRIAGLVGEELANPENADSIVTAWGKLYTTEIIKGNNLDFTDTKIIGTEDALFNLNYFGFSKKCVFINQPFNHYRKDNETSLTKKYKANLFLQWTELYNRMENYLKNNSCSEDFYDGFYNRICLSMIGLGLNELCNEKGSSDRIKNIKKILSDERYIKAYQKLEMKYFPKHWKIFFTLCKKQNANGVYLLLKAMQMMIGK